MLRRISSYLWVLRCIHLRDDGCIIIHFYLLFYHCVLMIRWHDSICEPLPSLADDLLSLAAFSCLISCSYRRCCSYGRYLIVRCRIDWVRLRMVDCGWLLRKVMRYMKLLTYLWTITDLSSLLWYSLITSVWRNKVLLASRWALDLLEHLWYLLAFKCVMSIGRICFLMVRWMEISESLGHCPWIRRVILLYKI